MTSEDAKIHSTTPQLLGPFCTLSDADLVSPAAATTVMVPEYCSRTREAAFPRDERVQLR